MRGLGLGIGLTSFGQTPSGPVIPFFYLQPDAVSLYRRPGGVDLYVRP